MMRLVGRPASARQLLRAGVRAKLFSICTAALEGVHKIGSRTRLRPRDAAAYRGLEPPLLSDIAQVVCSASVLPRKELFETWVVASYVHEAFPAVRRVADLAAGHGLLGWLLLVLAAESGLERTAVCVDVKMPASADALAAAFAGRWPLLAGSLHYVVGNVDAVRAAPDVLLASIHACGGLSDAVLAKAMAGNSPVAVLPCCHSLWKQPLLAVPGLTEESLREAAMAVGPAAAIDGFRLQALRLRGYTAREITIPQEITKCNRLLLGTPPPASPAAGAAPVLAASSSAEVAAAASHALSSHDTSSQIVLTDVAAVAAMAGRRPRTWVRSIDLSLWITEEPAAADAASGSGLVNKSESESKAVAAEAAVAAAAAAVAAAAVAPGSCESVGAKVPQRRPRFDGAAVAVLCSRASRAPVADIRLARRSESTAQVAAEGEDTNEGRAAIAAETAAAAAAAAAAAWDREEVTAAVFAAGSDDGGERSRVAIACGGDGGLRELPTWEEGSVWVLPPSGCRGGGTADAVAVDGDGDGDHDNCGCGGGEAPRRRHPGEAVGQEETQPQRRRHQQQQLVRQQHQPHQQAPTVRVVLRELYRDPRSGRTGATFRVDFCRSGRDNEDSGEVTRAEAAVWQLRVRAALRLWGEASGRSFELR
jgi:hypothetical protein